MLTTKRTWKRIGLGFVAFVTLVIGGLFAEWHYTHGQGLKRLHELEAKLDVEDPGWRWDEIVAEHHRKYPPDEQTAMAKARRIQITPRQDDWFAFQQVRLVDRSTAEEDDEADWININRFPGQYSRLLRSMSLEYLQSGIIEAELVADSLDGAPSMLFSDRDDVQLVPLDGIAIARCIQLLEYDALNSIDQSDFDATLLDIHRIINLGEYAIKSPHIMYLTTYQSSAVLGCELLEKLLARTSNPGGLSALLKRFETFQDQVDLPFFLRAERARIHDVYTRIQQGTLNRNAFLLPRDRVAGFQDRLAYRYEEKSYPDMCSQNIEDINDWIVNGFPKNRFFLDENRYIGNYVLNHVKFGPLNWIDDCVDWLKRANAHLALARTMILVEQYQLKHHDWPENLQGLSKSQIPLDPYTGDCLGYHIFPDYVLINSLGRNKRDESDPSSNGFTPDDILRKLYDPSLRGLPPQPEPINEEWTEEDDFMIEDEVP